MYKDELDNPNRPASKFKTDAMAIHEKLQRAREVMAKTPASEEVSEVPAVTSQSAPVLLTVNGDVPLASNSQVKPCFELVAATNNEIIWIFRVLYTNLS
jgi:hypothetical protein